MMLERELEMDKIIVKREKVGDVFVANRVKNENAVLGVERSGHFFLPEFQYSDDPFVMSLAIAEIISDGEKLSQLADEIQEYRPYDSTDTALTKLQDNLAKYNPDDATLQAILGVLKP